MFVNGIRDYIFENYYELNFLKRTVIIQRNAWKKIKKKDLLLLANNLLENIPDPCNAKEHYQPYIRKKNRKLVKQSK